MVTHMHTGMSKIEIIEYVSDWSKLGLTLRLLYMYQPTLTDTLVTTNLVNTG